jgi:uroporphyrinogen decarboxylase
MDIRERYAATLAFEPVDRPPLFECGYWAATIRRFCREGLVLEQGIPDDLPDGRGVSPFLVPEIEAQLGLDPYYRTMPVNPWVYPPFEREILEDHGEWVLMRNTSGVIQKQRKDRMSIPVQVSGPVQTREDWERIKAERLQPTLEGRVPDNWGDLVIEYRNRDYLLYGLSCEHWAGALVRLVGLERSLTLFYDDPELLKDMIDHITAFWVALADQVLRQVVPDVCTIGGDFCYKNGPMMSPAAFREYLLPGFQALSSIMRDYGVPAVMVHSDGDVRPIMPLLIESGVTGLHPFEVTNGQDIVEIREAFPRFQVFGGLDKQALVAGKEAIDRELEAKLPYMLRHGGYIPYVDHYVSPDISWQNFLYYRRRVNEFVVGEAARVNR